MLVSSNQFFFARRNSVTLLYIVHPCSSYYNVTCLQITVGAKPYGESNALFNHLTRNCFRRPFKPRRQNEMGYA